MRLETLCTKRRNGTHMARHTAFALLVALALVACLVPRVALAATRGANSLLEIDDQASLLSDDEKQHLTDDYARLSEYLSASVVTLAQNNTSTSDFAASYLRRTYGDNKTAPAAIVFVIDMDNRQIYLFANDAGLATISSADARAITDNIYTYASDGKYYACVDAALSQVLTKCEGGRIARPVKHITNALIAIVLGILANFLYALFIRSRGVRELHRAQGPQGASELPTFLMDKPIVTKSVRHYHSSSSGSGGSGGGGGGGGGGHGF